MNINEIPGIDAIVSGIFLIIFNLIIQILSNISSNKKAEYISKLQTISNNKKEFSSHLDELVSRQINELIISNRKNKILLMIITKLSLIIGSIFIGIIFSFQPYEGFGGFLSVFLTKLFIFGLPIIMFTTLIVNSSAIFKDMTYTIFDFVSVSIIYIIFLFTFFKNKISLTIKLLQTKSNKNNDKVNIIKTNIEKTNTQFNEYVDTNKQKIRYTIGYLLFMLNLILISITYNIEFYFNELLKQFSFFNDLKIFIEGISGTSIFTATLSLSTLITVMIILYINNIKNFKNELSNFSSK